MDKATLRWLAVIPTAIAAYVLSAFVGFALIDVAQSFCPPDCVVSGGCIAPWSRSVERGITAFATALAAFLMVVAPALVAPAHRIPVARGIFLIGATVAIAIAILAGLVVEAASAVVAGLAGAYLINRRYKGNDA